MIVTIDGDGCWNPKWMKNIYQIVASHPDIKFTGSLITAYYDGTLRESMAETITEIAKQIFALPNIEVATHSHTHPNDWEVQDARNLTSTPWTVEEEIEKSQKIIRRRSLPRRPGWIPERCVLLQRKPGAPNTRLFSLLRRRVP